MQKYKIIFCDDVGTYLKLEELLRNAAESERETLVVSDSVQLHYYLSQNVPSQKKIFLYDGDILFDVQEDANRIIDEINRVFFSALSKEDQYILKWGKHYEGGAPQKIIDTLIYINTINRILDEYKAEEIFCQENGRNNLIKDTFEKLAKKKEIHFSRVGIKTNNKYGYRKQFNILGRKIEVYLPQTSAFLATQLTIYFKTVRLMIRKHCKRAVGKYHIIICLDGRGMKHLIDAKILESAFCSNGNTDVTFLFSTEEAVNEVQGRPVQGENIESYLSLADLFSAAGRHRKTVRRIKDSFSELQEINNNHFFYNQVDITELIMIEMRKFTEIDTLRHLILASASKNYFTSCRLDAVKLFGTPNFHLARIYDWAISSSALYGKEKPLLFTVYTEAYAWGISYETPLLLSGEYICFASRNLIKYQGFEKYQYAVGSSRITNAYQSRNTRNTEKKDTNSPLQILLATGYPLTGYESTQDIAHQVDCMVEFAIKNQNVIQLCIKPHPGDTGDVAGQVVKHKKQNQSVILIDKKESILDWIARADVVVVGFSTVALEAMAMEKPVISITTEKSKRFNRDIGEAMLQFQDYEELQDTLKAVCLSRESYETWAEQRVREQNKLLNAEFLYYSETPETMIANSIMKKIENRSQYARNTVI